VAWPDECIYLVGARNVLERGTLDTNFYLTHSLLARGHPHRDVHMPGYVLSLVPFVALRGATLEAGTTLNVMLFLLCIPLVYVIALRLLEDHWQASAAAALFTILPPFPGYLFVVYPEIVTAFVFLAGLAWLVNGSGMRHAVVAGVLFGIGPLLRETLLLALPLYLVRIPRRELLRGFVPAAAGTLLLAVPPLAQHRAVHPNAIFPGVIVDAWRSETPLSTLAQALSVNLKLNLRLLSEASPVSNPEDAVLAFLLALAVAAALAWRFLGKSVRRLALATAIALGLLTGAVAILYVFRVKGGVWGGVRVYMVWAPVLLILATPLLFRARRWWITVTLLVALCAGFVALDHSQMRFFDRYKRTDYEDQNRNARYIASYIDRYRPHRIVSRSFLYGLRAYPVEVVWSLPKSYEELRALEAAIDYEFLVIHEKKPLRRFLIRNPRYLRINKDDRGAEFLIWRRLD